LGMKKLLIRLPQGLKAVRELGLAQTFWYAVYQVGMRSGFYRRATPTRPYPTLTTRILSPFAIPDRQQMQRVLGSQLEPLIAEANAVAAGQVCLFGGPVVPLVLAPPDATRHWTAYEARPKTWGVEDLKFLWEPARFGWVYGLGRAFAITADEKYPAAFWENFKTFLNANPLNQGPNWSSAQEAALRLLAFIYAAGAFKQSSSSTPAQFECLAGAIAVHAQRILPTLSYARAQNNNHRITEALGLYAAGCTLPDHPLAKGWRKTGWDEINRAFQSQIEPDGTYAQHSMNYHRLMLHAALQAQLFGQAFPQATARRLAAAALWLLAQVDPQSGRVPNLGSNDGANILPLSSGEFGDFRPAGQAAARAFLGQAAFPPGAWDEMALWLRQPMLDSPPLPALPQSPAVHRLGDSHSWATVRAVRFKSRPSQADQLHIDLWWRGENIALDAGTYRYTAAAPWDNALGQTFVHNTVEVGGQNQMRRAGRFLWLDRAQARLFDTRSFSNDAIAAQHDGYQHLGVLHKRSLKKSGNNH
ncbi:MAG: hypothetical protein EHM21_17150, partial [Chloroflexi bacterium]